MRAGGLEVALAGALLGAFLTIPVRWAHLSFGVAFALLVLAHIGRRRRVYLAVLRRRRRRAVVSAVLVGSAVVMTVSGIVQWASVAAAIPWHGASSMLLILLATGHAIRRVRRGRARGAAAERAVNSTSPTSPVGGFKERLQHPD